MASRAHAHQIDFFGYNVTLCATSCGYEGRLCVCVSVSVCYMLEATNK